jgi:hypothetical protein
MLRRSPFAPRPLGGPHEARRREAADLAPIIAELWASGAQSLQAIAAALNERFSVKSPVRNKR